MKYRIVCNEDKYLIQRKNKTNFVFFILWSIASCGLVFIAFKLVDKDFTVYWDTIEHTEPDYEVALKRLNEIRDQDNIEPSDRVIRYFD